MNKAIFLTAQAHLADFLFREFPSLPGEEQARLYQGLCGVLRWAIQEIELENAMQRMKEAARRSRN